MTQREFAKMINVSQATVSMALNDSPEISLKMRRHIQEMAHKVGYRPNLAGQLLRKGRTNLIAVLLPSIQYGFYAELLEQIYIYAQKCGYIIFWECCDNEETFAYAVKTIKQYNVAGIIASARLEWVENYVKNATPTILINSEHGEDFPAWLANVCPNMYSCGRQVAEYLIEKGRKKLVFAGYGILTEDRFRGICDVCNEKGIPAPEILDDQENSAKTGYEAAGDLLKKYPDCDALIAHNDNVAIGILRRFYEEKISVPERIAVVGFDNITAGSFTAPALTSIGAGFDIFAKTVIDELLKIISGSRSKRKIRLECKLNIRESI